MSKSTNVISLSKFRNSKLKQDTVKFNITISIALIAEDDIEPLTRLIASELSSKEILPYMASDVVRSKIIVDDVEMFEFNFSSNIVNPTSVASSIIKEFPHISMVYYSVSTDGLLVERRELLYTPKV